MMEGLKRSKAVFIMAIIVVMCMILLSGCGSNTSTDSDTLVVACSEETGDLNPHTYDSPMWIQSLVYEGMTRFENGKVVSGIAKSWNVSKDGKTYTFHLDKENKFSDGTPVNAKIVKKNFDAVLACKENHDWMETYRVLKSVDAIDKYTVRFNLRAPFSGLLQELSLSRPDRVGAEAMFPKNGDTSKSIDKPIGSGPWKLAEHKEDEYAVFERNENYHGTKPDFKKLKVMIIPDINTAANALKSGEIDMIYDLDGQMTGDVYNELKDSGYKANISDPVATNMVLVNTNSGVTKEKAVRKALEYAVDKKSIAKGIYNDLQPAADYLMNPKTTYCNDPKLKVYKKDLKKAKKLLDGAGWKYSKDDKIRTKNGKKLSIRFFYEGENESIKNIAQVLQSQYEEVGIEVKLVAQDSNNYYKSQKKGEFELLQAATWGDPFDPHSYMSSFRVPGHGDCAAQKGLKEKPKIDRAVANAMNAMDKRVIEKNYHYILETLTDEAVYIPLTYTTTPYVYNSDKLSNVIFNTRVDVPYEKFKCVKK